MGVLQTTVAEIVTVKEHQRMHASNFEGRPMLNPTSSRVLYHALRLVSRVRWSRNVGSWLLTRDF